LGDFAGKRVICKKAVFGLVSAGCLFARFVAELLQGLGFVRSTVERQMWMRHEPETGL